MSATVINYYLLMGRWEPNARGRLQQAALDLFTERGYEQTTAAEIAKRAGLTERTFFRYFADKREVLFSGGEELQQLFVDAITGAPESATPIEAAGAALAAAAAQFEERIDSVRQRQAVVTANADLRERELIKLTALAAAVADALRERGVADTTASLTAEVTIAVFRISFERWLNEAGQQTMARIGEDLLAELKVVAGT
jgi:AcrR family transcriptional regulator